MIVYLLRHGIAENSSPGGRDADRELTNEGRERLADVLKRAHRGGVEPDVILASPYKRAMQTAKMAAGAFDGPEPEACEALVPHGNPRDVWAELRTRSEAKQILIAGHEPLLSQAVAYLLYAPGMAVEMKKAAMVSIEIDSMRGDPKGILRWMLIPKICG